MTLAAEIDFVMRWDTTDAVRAALEVLRANVDVATITMALDVLRRDASGAVAAIGRGLGEEFPDELLGALVPHAEFSEHVDVRMFRTWPGTSDWHGDLLIQPNDDMPGAFVTIGSVIGVRALAALSREVRAAITRIWLVGTGHTREATEELARLELDGVRRVDASAAFVDHAAELVLRCGALETYHGSDSSPNLADALATTAVLDVHLVDPDDATLAALAPAAHLARLELFRHQGAQFTTEGLRSLRAIPRLRSLCLSHCRIANHELPAIATLDNIERLFVFGNPFTDEGGVSLSRMTALRALDLHGVGIGDATVVALAELPLLAELDLEKTMVGVPGIQALARARSLKRLGLAKYEPEEILAAARQLTGVSVELAKRGRDSSGALWGSR